MKRTFLLLFAFSLLLSACSPAVSSVGGAAQQTTTSTAPTIDPLVLVEKSSTAYTVVYDDSDPLLTDIYTEFIRLMELKLRVSLASVPASEAEADYGKEILIGDVRGSEEKLKGQLEKSDFAAVIDGDDWRLLATSQSMYRYLFSTVSEQIFSNLSKGSLSVESNLFYHSSLVAEVPLAEKLRDANGKLNVEALRRMTEALTFEASDGTRLAYRFYLPSNYDASKDYPLVVFLHGAGDRGDDNVKQIETGMIKMLFNLEESPYQDAIMIIPQCSKEDRWVETPWNQGTYSTELIPESKTLRAVVELTEQVRSEFQVDAGRIYAMGVSMGGFGTWDLITRHPDLFAAAMPLCGAGDPTMASAIRDMPIYTFHGSADTTVPVQGTRAMVQALQDAGSTKLIYEELPGEDHLIQGIVFARPEVSEWLFSQKKEG